MMLSDVSESVKASGEATVPSVPVKPVNQTSVSSGDEKAGDVSSVKSEVLSAASSGPSKSIGKAGVSVGLNIGAKYKASVSYRDKGKAIVGKAITFRDVTFGPYDGEIRFRLIHFWEAWNVQTKVLIGLEMILIDEEVKTDSFCNYSLCNCLFISGLNQIFSIIVLLYLNNIQHPNN